MNLAPFRTTPDVTPAMHSEDWTLACRSEPGSQSLEDDDLAENGSDSAISVFSAAMDKPNNVGPVSPLTFQLKTKWDDVREDEKDMCIDKATEACSLVCDIAPYAGQ